MAHSADVKDIGQPENQIESLQQALADLEKERDRLADLTLGRRPSQTISKTSDDTETFMQLFRASFEGSRCLLLDISSRDRQYYMLDKVILKSDPGDSDTPSGGEVYVGCLKCSDLEAFNEAYRNALPIHKRQTGPQETSLWIEIIIDRLQMDGLLMQTSQDADAIRRAEALRHAQQILRQHINLLNKYNEIKDVATGLIGMIAEARQERIVDVMRTFELEVNE